MDILVRYLEAAKENLERYRQIEDPEERARAVRAGEVMVFELEAEIERIQPK